MCVCLDPTTMVELWKESPKGLVKEGDTVELRCQGDGNPPSPFIFTRGQVRIEAFSHPKSPQERMGDTQETCRECFWYAELTGPHIDMSVQGL